MHHGLVEYILSIMDFPQKQLIAQENQEVSEESKKLFPFLEAVYSQMADEVRKFMDKMPGGFFIYRADGNEEIIYANRALLFLFQCNTMQEFQELTGNTFRGLVHPEDIEEVEASIKEQLAHSRYDMDYVEYRIIRKDGKIRWIEDYGHFIHSESVGDIFYVFVGDATDKKRKQEKEKNALLSKKSQREKLLQSQIEQYDKELKVIHQEHLRRLEIIEGLSTNYESILYADLDSNEVLPYRMSNRIERQFGESFEARDFVWFMSDYIRTWVCEEDKETISKVTTPNYICDKLSRNKTFYVNYKVLNNKEMQYLQLRIVDTGSTGHISQIVIGCRRVDEEVRYEMKQKEIFEGALRDAKLANIAKNTFLSNMSHDMRTPLNAIVGFTALAKNHINEPEKTLDFLEKIESSSEQLLHLINNILEITRIESGKMQKEEMVFSLFDVMQDIQKTMKPYAEAKEIAFSIDMIDFKHNSVIGDREKLNRILMCLVSNAIKYTNREGNVRVTVVEKNATNNYATYHFVVEDNGIGIGEEYLERIFEPFERVENTTLSGVYGTGLGLTIAKNFVEMMSGSISVQSSPGNGSRFMVGLSFRIQESSPDSVESTKDILIKLLNKRKVLLVDDNELNLEIAAELLQDIGVQVDMAENGKIAVEKIISSMPGEYALILMDIQMPVMDGYQAARAIRAAKDTGLANIPIIALSANAFEEDQRKSWESGMNAHMAKPFNMPKLMELMISVLCHKEEKI